MSKKKTRKAKEMEMIQHSRLITVEDYAPYIGHEAVDRIRKKASRLQGLHVANVNSTYYGGGVATLLSSMTLLMNGLGLHTGWRVIQGAPDFFGVTKQMHNALQSGRMNLTPKRKRIYQDVVYENSIRNHLEHHDLVVVHDPQPLPLIQHYRKKIPWIWRCHIDLTKPQPEVWDYLRQFVERYDAAIFSLPEYGKKMKVPQVFFMPAIDPYTIKNQPISAAGARKVFQEYGIPTDLPIVTQVSRFDKWKDPEGVIKAYKIARRKADCTLVLIGNGATDDPEGQQVYESLLSERDERVIISTAGDDSDLINALQTHSAVVIQKSIREGFGLTVTEAMWKGTPVIGGNCGGIRYQIKDGETGYLVSNVEECADRIVRLVRDKRLRGRMGKAARENVRKKFLMTRLVEEYLNLFLALTTRIQMDRKARVSMCFS